jgi:2-polyprenyl-3-methyl-5-hydroxy-6-metoxy-1,4-benzoquinol methylase
MNCPLCDGDSSRLFQKYGYWIRTCKICQHRFAEIDLSKDHVAQVYGDDYFKGGRAGYPDYLAEGELLRAHGRRYGKLLRKYMQPGHLLDVGCAAGFIMLGLQDEGWQVTGVEPNARMAEYARLGGLQVHTGTLEELQTTEKFDLVTMIQVLPHLYDIRQALRTAAELTKPGGFWLIETWDRSSLTARLLGSHWHEYSPPSVLHWFARKSLSNIIGDLGFYEISHEKTAKSINLNHAFSLLLNKVKGQPIKLPNVSIPYCVDDLFWSIYQREET